MSGGTVKVARVRLCHSRMYPPELTQSALHLRVLT
jgi:hypothetical protein